MSPQIGPLSGQKSRITEVGVEVEEGKGMFGVLTLLTHYPQGIPFGVLVQEIRTIVHTL